MSVETPTLTPTPTLPFWEMSEAEILWSLQNQKPTTPPTTPTSPLCPPDQEVVYSTCPDPQDDFNLENAPPGPLSYDPTTGSCFYCKYPDTPSTTPSTPDKYSHTCSDPSSCGCYVDPGGAFDSLAACEADYEATKCEDGCAPECCDKWTWYCTGDPGCGCFQELAGGYDSKAECDAAYNAGKSDLTMCDEACACEDCTWNPAVPESNCGFVLEDGYEPCPCDCSFCQQGGKGYVAGQCDDDCWYNAANGDTSCGTEACPCTNALCQGLPEEHNPCLEWEMYADDTNGCGCFNIGQGGTFASESDCLAKYNGYLSECFSPNKSVGFFFEFNCKIN